MLMIYYNSLQAEKQVLLETYYTDDIHNKNIFNITDVFSPTHITSGSRSSEIYFFP